MPLEPPLMTATLLPSFPIIAPFVGRSIHYTDVDSSTGGPELLRSPKVLLIRPGREAAMDPTKDIFQSRIAIA